MRSRFIAMTARRTQGLQPVCQHDRMGTGDQPQLTNALPLMEAARRWRRPRRARLVERGAAHIRNRDSEIGRGAAAPKRNTRLSDPAKPWRMRRIRGAGRDAPRTRRAE